MTCTNIVLCQTLLKLLKLLGHTHKYKIVSLFDCNNFLNTHINRRGGMHLATQDAHLLNFSYLFNRLINTKIVFVH